MQGNLTQYYRGRIVDKLGNTSDWTAWQRGTTSADASKVLDILSGQISSSHLDQTLRTPIAKINTLDRSIATINGKMPNIETSIAKIPNIEQQIRLDTSKLAEAIKDIDELTKDKNAKTKELINLKQTVGNQTSTIRELGITTGDLSQKYLQLKTVSDGYDTEIKKIQQTTKEQAIEQTRLRSSYSDNLLESHDSVTTSDYLMTKIPMRRLLERGQNVVITIYADLGDDRTGLMIANSTPHAASVLHRFNKIANGVYQAAVNWNDGIGSNDSVLVYQLTSSSTSSSTLHNVRITLADAMMPNILDNNLLVSSADYNIARYKLNSSPAHGEPVVITIYGNLGSGRTHFGLYNSGGDTLIGTTTKVGDGMYQWSGAWNTTTNRGGTASNDSLLVYQFASTASSESTISRIVVERSPNALALQSTQASLDEFKLAQAKKDSATAESIKTLQTTVGGQTTSIRNVERSVNGTMAIKAVTVDSNGFISGYGLMSDLQNGRVTSSFGINADYIYFGATSSAKKPFIFTTRTSVIDGVTYPAGAWFNTAHIANASIKLAHIDKASINSLSALSADIGTLRTSDSRGTFTYTGSKIELRDPRGRLLLEMGLL